MARKDLLFAVSQVQNFLLLLSIAVQVRQALLFKEGL